MSKINKVVVKGVSYALEDSEARKKAGKAIAWNSTQHLDSYKTAGVYLIDGTRTTSDGFPINNTGVISARLTVLVTYSDDVSNLVITQVLNLNNNGGGEGNIYIRSYQNGVWKPWGKLQTNVEVNAIGLGQEKTFDDFTDNGMYSGVNVYSVGTDSNGYPITAYETFVLVVINAYLTGGGISQLKYSLKDGVAGVETRTRTSGWSEWNALQGEITQIPEATTTTAGTVKLGAFGGGSYVPILNIDSSNGSGLGLRIDSAVFNNDRNIYGENMLGLYVSNQGGLTIEDGLTINLGTVYGLRHNAIPLCIGTPANLDIFNQFTGNKVAEKIPSIPVNPYQFKLGVMGLELTDPDSVTANKVTWDSLSNMNDFITSGIYDIYGERTRQDDNLPILNASSGHSIAARLTVVASTLQPANNEICVTQFLMLSNRLGGEGNMYVRTYNENNSPFMNGWAPWQKLQGIREGYIFTDEDQVNPDGGIETIVGTTGLYNMIDNGIYSGIYTDDYTFQAPTFIETFTLIVINNYAVAAKDERLKRTISQLKYAVDAITNQASVKQRTKTDGSDWSDWEDISGGGSQEVDVTDAVNQYGLYTLYSQGFMKDNVVYKYQQTAGELPQFDYEDLIRPFLISKGYTDRGTAITITIKKFNSIVTLDVDMCANLNLGGDNALNHYKFITATLSTVKVSADMTEL